MSNCLSNYSPDLEDELVSLYSTLVDEDSFTFKDDEVIPQEDFLKDVEEKLVERGELPNERSRLNQVKNKILEKVKNKKLNRVRSRERRDSISSLSSVGSKRGNGECAGGDPTRLKLESSSLPQSSLIN